MAVSKEFVQSVRQRLQERPGISMRRIADELGASEADAILCMPVTMRTRANIEDAPELLQKFALVKHLVLDMEAAAGAAADASRPGPSGVSYLADESAVPVRTGEIGAIWFVSKEEENGMQSHSLRFFAQGGAHLFSLYLGRDASGRIDPHAKALFDGAKKRFGVIPVPRKQRCSCAGACVSCGCKGNDRLLAPLGTNMAPPMRELSL